MSVQQPRLVPFSQALRPADWPVALKLIGLSVGVSVLLAIGLSTIGYVSASTGLTEQAESAVIADGQLTADAVDEWNSAHVAYLQMLSGVADIQQVATEGAASSDVTKARAAQALQG